MEIASTKLFKENKGSIPEPEGNGNGSERKSFS